MNIDDIFLKSFNSFLQQESEHDVHFKAFKEGPLICTKCDLRFCSFKTDMPSITIRLTNKPYTSSTQYCIELRTANPVVMNGIDIGHGDLVERLRLLSGSPGIIRNDYFQELSETDKIAVVCSGSPKSKLKVLL